MRLITQVKHMESQGKTSRDICSKLRIPPFTLPSLSSNAKRTDWDKIKYIYDKVASLDFEIKIGNIDAQTGLTLLLSRV
jgi:DNA polymerase III delta subunit